MIVDASDPDPLGDVPSVDPFFVVDLSRPRAPRVLAELKVPGYSGYLHPVGDGRVLGVGPAVAGRVFMTVGARAALFDVTAPTGPRRADVLGLRPRPPRRRGRPARLHLPARRTDRVRLGWLRDEPRAGKGRWRGCADEYPLVVGVGVGADGVLREVGRFRADSTVRRVLPVGDRLASSRGRPSRWSTRTACGRS